jgi:hypothetical protein
VTPGTMQQTETESEQQNGPKPPEYWTEANTAAWTAEVFGTPEERQSKAQQGWGRKYTHGDIIPKARLSAPPSAETMAQWRLNDPRPRATHYYDGTPITSYQPLRVKKPRARKVAA